MGSAIGIETAFVVANLPVVSGQLTVGTPTIFARGVFGERADLWRWAVQADGYPPDSADGLVEIRDGDFLMIYGANLIHVRETIRVDRVSAWRPYNWVKVPEGRIVPFEDRNPSNGCPRALDHWVDWIQSGWEADAWARLFIQAEAIDRSLRALLLRPS